MQEELKKQEEKSKYISIEDFAKIEIRLGTVVDVEEVEGSDKLYRLTVDFGESKEIENDDGMFKTEKHYRNVFSGIKKFVSVEDIKGKQFPFVTNLEPRKMMGSYSEAMILAASEFLSSGDNEENGKEVLALMSPSNKLSNGTRLR